MSSLKLFNGWHQSLEHNMSHTHIIALDGLGNKTLCGKRLNYARLVSDITMAELALCGRKGAYAQKKVYKEMAEGRCRRCLRCMAAMRRNDVGTGRAVSTSRRC